MYLFSEKEVRKIREALNRTSTTIRGWTLEKKVGSLKKLNISNIASTYCRTDRKLFQTYYGVSFGTSEAMIRGSAIHSIVERVFSLILTNSRSAKSLANILSELKSAAKLDQLVWNGSKLQELRNISENVLDYQHRLTDLEASMREIVDLEIKRLSDPELTNKVKIMDLERFVTGDVLNLGTGKLDVIFKCEKDVGIGDLKTGKSWRDNKDVKIQVALYSMLLEAATRKSVDWGAVIFPFDSINGHKTLKIEPLKEIFGIGDTLRFEALDRLEKVEDILSSSDPPELCSRCTTLELCSRVIS